MGSSLREWFNELPWMQQGVLLGAIRNCDGMPSIDTPHKILIRGVRSACIKSAKMIGSFNARRPDLDCLEQASFNLINDNYIDALPFHFVAHLIFAAEVLAYSHPDNRFREVWFSIYKRMIDSMHLNPETYEQYINRLKDDEGQKERETKHDDICFKSGFYGDGTGTINENTSNNKTL